MSDRSTESLLQAAFDALDALEAWTNDCSDVNRLAAVKDAMPGLTDRVKLIAAATNTSLRALVASGPVFMPDGRTILIETDDKRVLRSGAREKIRSRIVSRAIALAEGETGFATMEKALEVMEETYLSPSTLPKWGGLQLLGFSSWDEVAEANTQEKGVIIK